jgi:hypothetical protein
VSSVIAKKPPRALTGFAADASLSKGGSHHVDSSAMWTQLTVFIHAGHHPGEVYGDIRHVLVVTVADDGAVDGGGQLLPPFLGAGIRR